MEQVNKFGQLFKEACLSNSSEQAREYLQQHNDLICFRDEDGRSPLHFACINEDKELVNDLLTSGHPWNVVDSKGVSCGDLCKRSSDIYNLILNEGIRAELIYNLLEFEKSSNEISNSDYLGEKLDFTQDRLTDSKNNGIMMSWESFIMKKTVDEFQINNDSVVLNIGFGLGLIDTYIQEKNPKAHIIVEAHPDVYRNMVESGWNNKPNLKIIFGRWQEKIQELTEYQFDAIYFDTFGEYYKDLHEFNEHILDLLNQNNTNSTYSFFNGLGADNILFYDAYSEIAKIHLREMNLETEYIQVKVPKDVYADNKDVWKGISHQYWKLPIYNLPICRFIPN